MEILQIVGSTSNDPYYVVRIPVLIISCACLDFLSQPLTISGSARPKNGQLVYLFFPQRSTLARQRWLSIKLIYNLIYVAA